MVSRSERFAQAFEEILGRELDKAIVICLRDAERPVRYEELRKTVGEASPETFKRAIDGLTRAAVISRKLEPQGGRYLSYISPTPRGVIVADTLFSLGTKGRLPNSLPESVRADIQGVFLGQHPEPGNTGPKREIPRTP